MNKMYQENKLAPWRAAERDCGHTLFRPRRPRVGGPVIMHYYKPQRWFPSLPPHPPRSRRVRRQGRRRWGAPPGA